MKHKSHSDGQTCTSEADENNNKPLPDGGAALPTSETGQRRRVGIKKEKEKKKKDSEIQIRTSARQHAQVITDTYYSITFLE